jgi:TetR/AcrR family transcriptional regulator, cholesterol catabolism regulator
MRKKNKDVLHNLLSVARREFLEKGFKNTNMRTIAAKAGVGLSNIYNYFSNKDALFREIVQPVLDELERIILKHNDESHLRIDYFASQEELLAETSVYVDIITRYKKELHILLHKSQGSALDTFRVQYIDRHTEVGLEYMRLLKERCPHVNTDVSDFFIHTMSSWWIGIVGELVMHDLNRKELERFVTEYMEFVMAGWKRVMRIG